MEYIMKKLILTFCLYPLFSVACEPEALPLEVWQYIFEFMRAQDIQAVAGKLG